MYLPELNDTDLLKEKGKAAISLIELCYQFSVDDVSQLDPFTTKIANYMKSKGKQSKRAIATIIHTRRLALTVFCVNLIVEALALIEEQQKEKEEEEKKKKNDPNYAKEQNAASATSKPISIKDLSEISMKKLNETKGKSTRPLPSDINQSDSEDEEEEEESNESGIKEITDEEEQKAKQKQAKQKEKEKSKEKQPIPTTQSKIDSKPTQTPTPTPTSAPTPTPTQATKCSEPSCGKIETTSTSKFLICGGCKKQGLAVAYCSRECQIKHWATHKQNCGSKK